MTSRRKNTTPQEALAKLRSTFGERSDAAKLQVANEAATRLLLIDEVLEALGWSKDEFCPEERTASGEFTDYVLTANAEPWMIVEAKRAGATFDVPAFTGPRANTLVLALGKLVDRSGKSFLDATKQATRYCNDHAVPLACVTNGSQWIFFRGLSKEKEPWRSGTALVFRSAQELLDNFNEFWSALARDNVGTASLARMLDLQVESVSRQGERPLDSLEVYRPSIDADTAAYVRAASNAFLGDLYGDGSEDFLERCYIEPSTEGDFERSLRRLLEDASAVVDGESVQDGNPDDFVDELRRVHGYATASSPARQPIVVAGHVGAGKTTFIHRAFARLRQKADAYFAVVDLEGQMAGGTFDAQREQDRVAELVLGKLGRTAQTVLKNGGSSVEVAERASPDARGTIEALYGRELERERSLAGDLVTRQTDAWLQREYEFLSAHRQSSFQTLLRYTRYLRKYAGREGRSLPVVIVLDNVDTATDEYQRLMFGFAQQLSQGGPALVVLCLREDTYARGRESGGFLTSSALQFVFHVRSPAFDKLLRARVQFARRCLTAPDCCPAVLKTIVNSEEKLDDFLISLETILLAQKSPALEVIAALAGHNMRDGLGLVRSTAMGDVACSRKRQSTAAYALECLFAARNFTDATSGLHLANLYDTGPARTPTHALRMRLLAYFWWARDTQHVRIVNERSEIAIARFAALGYSALEVEHALRDLVQQRTLRPADRGEAALQAMGEPLPVRLTLTASGLVHVRRLQSLDAYRAAMALTTRWYEKADVHEFVS
jgi:hypothetical protein